MSFNYMNFTLRFNSQLMVDNGFRHRSDIKGEKINLTTQLPVSQQQQFLFQ